MASTDSLSSSRSQSVCYERSGSRGWQRDGARTMTGGRLSPYTRPDDACLPLHASEFLRLLSRRELVWVADTLARDLVSELTENPGGHETLHQAGTETYEIGWQEGTEPAWSRRYPGW